MKPTIDNEHVRTPLVLEKEEVRRAKRMEHQNTNRAAAAHKAKLITLQYYEEIAAEMAAHVAPTVQDKIAAMCRKGNRAFVEGFGIGELEETFEPLWVGHEITHLAGRLGHTPQQEFYALAFENGLTLGANTRDMNEKALTYQLNVARNREVFLRQSLRNYVEKPFVFSDRDRAIYTAAGMYLREKIESFLESPEAKESYGMQRNFCDTYVNHDSVPARTQDPTRKKQYHDLDYFDAIKHAPESLITLQPEEWRAIEAVALGMRSPEQTDYPQRLKPIKEALMHIGVFFDRPGFVEKLNKPGNDIPADKGASL